ncbi:MAG: CotH kinase family protein [Planctomycetota bacterium]
MWTIAPAFRFFIIAIIISFCVSVANAQNLLWRINCGGGTENGPGGTVYSADQAYSPGSGAGYILGGVSSSNVPIGGSGNKISNITKTARDGWRSYVFEVPAGDYVVRLQFAEINTSVQGPDQRVFNVMVQGQIVLSNLDIAARVGIQYATEFAATAHVPPGGTLTVSSSVDLDPALLNMIEVWSWSPDAIAPSVPGNATVIPGFQQNVVTWDASPEGDVAEYHIYRSAAPAGPYTKIGTVWPLPQRFVDSAAQPGVDSYYQITAADVFGNESAPAAAGAAQAFGDSQSAWPMFEIVITPENLKLLNTILFSQPKEEVPAKLIYKGIEYNVEVRYRGANSRRYSKKGWKVKFSANAPFFGRYELNFKAHYDDFSLSREPLAAFIYQFIGHPVAAHSPARLRVNGEYYGIYDMIENMDEEYLAAHGRDAGGSLYEVGKPFDLLGSPAEYEVYYEKKTNKQISNEDVIAFIELINNTAPPEFPEAIANALDVDGYLSYLAVVGWLGDADSILHNSYLLHDLSIGRWEVIAWDTDLGFGLSPFSLVPVTNYSIQLGTSGSPEEPLFGSNVLRTRVLNVPEFRWRYCEKIKALAAGAASQGVLGAKIDQFHASVQTEAKADMKKWGWESDALFQLGPSILKSFIDPRTTFLISQMASYQPADPPTTVWINEIVTDNAGPDADESGDQDPWIELYNAANAPADISGMYLTTNPTAPLLWRVPFNTIIPALSHLRIWCDNEPSEGTLHTNFKLALKGGTIALFDPSATQMLDFISYNPMALGAAFGRIPDAGAFFQYLPTPTPAAANVNSGNHAPSINSVTLFPKAPAPSDVVTISCLAHDADGIVDINVYWRVAGGVFVANPMSLVEENYYQTTVPPQQNGVVVEYYVEAADSFGKITTSPAHAPSDFFSYTPVSPAFGAIRIQELMADNSGFPDEFGNNDDWVELVNTSNAAVDVGGMYMTDNLANPKKWKIPSGITIPAKGFLVIWADDQAAQGPLHASFKLSKDGESIGLFDTDANLNSFLDGFTFGAQNTNISLGLLPDGGSVLVKLQMPTPGGSNVPAQGASALYSPPGSTGNPIVMIPKGTANLGQDFHYSVSGSTPNADGYALFGGDPFAADLPGIGILLINPEIFTIYSANGSGAAAASVSIPNDPFFVNFTFYAQAYSPTKGLSNGVATKIAP